MRKLNKTRRKSKTRPNRAAGAAPSKDLDPVWTTVIALILIVGVIVIVTMRDDTPEKSPNMPKFSEPSVAESEPASKEGHQAQNDAVAQQSMMMAAPIVTAPNPKAEIVRKQVEAASIQVTEVEEDKKPAAVKQTKPKAEDDLAMQNYKLRWEAHKRAEKQTRMDFDNGTGVYREKPPVVEGEEAVNTAEVSSE